MYKQKTLKFNKEVSIIHPGELHVSSNDDIIGTLLGSCVSVCLIDVANGVSGMNHFMLPGKLSSSDIFKDRTARYGIIAINHLLEEMIMNGAMKRNIVAKIFGGGHVLETVDSSANVPEDNIRLARAMMEIEDIPIVKSDVGDKFTRKLMLEVKTGKVFLKKTTKEDVYRMIHNRESNFSRSIQK